MGGHEPPVQHPLGRPPPVPPPPSRPRPPSGAGEPDCVRRLSPPYGARRMPAAGPPRSLAQVGTVPWWARTRPVASSASTGRRSPDHAPGSGAAPGQYRCELATRYPSVATDRGEDRRCGSSRQPDPPPAPTSLQDRATGACRHPMAKTVPSRSLAGVWLERPLHLTLVS